VRGALSFDSGPYFYKQIISGTKEKSFEDMNEIHAFQNILQTGAIYTAQ